jgi:hypothetical protein
MCFNWRLKMNKSKIALGVLCVVVTATLVYKQAQSPEQAKQDSISDVVKESRGVPTANLESANALPRSSSLSDTVQAQSSEAQNTRVTSAVKSQNKSNHLPSTHEQPADHRSASQPKHHGHEHAQPKRHPEDNSIIPPGEPKKPVPEQ